VHWLLLQILEEAGLGLNDVKVVYTAEISADRQRLSGGGRLDDVGSAAQRRRTHRRITGGCQRRRRVNNHQFYLSRRDYASRNSDIMQRLLPS
jgi:hypothetical protein